MSGAKTLIIILHFGPTQDTLECLASLKGSVDTPFDVFVVNNGPDKDVEGSLKAEHPEITYHYAGFETGFAAGNNIGLRYSLEHSYGYSLLLNNDTIAEQDFLKPLVSLMEEDQSVALAGPAIYYYDNKDRLWSCGGKIRWWSGGLCGNANPERLLLGSHDVGHLPGACILARNQAVRKIGLMSDQYFLGVEEADWAIRARRNGFKVVAEPKAKLLHKVGVSSRFTPELVYNAYRNRFLFLRRQYPVVVSLFLSCGVILNGLRKRWSSRRICLRAFKDHFKYSDIRRSHLNAVRNEMKNERELQAW
jgi:GT2 family glycosyltransferase